MMYFHVNSRTNTMQVIFLYTFGGLLFINLNYLTSVWIWWQALQYIFPLRSSGTASSCISLCYVCRCKMEHNRAAGRPVVVVSSTSQQDSHLTTAARQLHPQPTPHSHRQLSYKLLIIFFLTFFLKFEFYFLNS